MKPGGASRVALVARRKAVERTRTKSFRIATAIYVLAAAAAVVIPSMIDDHGPPTFDLGLVGRTPPGLEQAVTGAVQAVDARVRVRTFPALAEAEAAVRDEEVDGVVVDGERLVVLVRRADDDLLPLLVNQSTNAVRIQDSLARAGVGASEASELLAGRALPVEQLDPSSRSDSQPLVFAGIILLYITLITYGTQVATGVVEEKSSRVSEILLGAVRPSQLLAGKVVGIGAVGVLQLLAIGAGVLVATSAVSSVDLPDGSPLTFASVLLWFVLGYAFYSCAFAAVGASISRAEEVGGAPPRSTCCCWARTSPPLRPSATPTAPRRGSCRSSHPDPDDLVGGSPGGRPGAGLVLRPGPPRGAGVRRRHPAIRQGQAARGLDGRRLTKADPD